MESIDKSHRVAVHLVSVGGGQPYGQLTVTQVKEYQTGFPSGNPTSWTTQPGISFGKKGGVTTYSFSFEEKDLLGTGRTAAISYDRDIDRINRSSGSAGRATRASRAPHHRAAPDRWRPARPPCFRSGGQKVR